MAAQGNDKLPSSRLGINGKISVDDIKTYVKNDLVLTEENYTTVEKSKLASITAIFTTALKTAYDAASSWVVTNGANVLNHLSRTDNPHNVTEADGSINTHSDVNLDNVNYPPTSELSVLKYQFDTSDFSNRWMPGKLEAYEIIADNFSGTNYIDNTGNSEEVFGILDTEIGNNATAIGTIQSDQTTQDAAIALNTAKRSYPLADETRLANTSGTNTGDQDISGISTNASAISTLQSEQTTQDNAIALNTAKVSAEGSVTTHNDVTSAGSGQIITSAERTNLSNQSGTNTGDETTATIQTKRPLKTVDGYSLEGSGGIETATGFFVKANDLSKFTIGAQVTATDQGDFIRVTNTNNTRDSAGTTGGLAVEILEDVAMQFSEKRVRVEMIVQPVGAVTQFQAAYSTNDAGNSGLQTFTFADTSIQQFAFEYDVPKASLYSTDWFGIWADGSPNTNGLQIDVYSIRITVVENLDTMVVSDTTGEPTGSDTISNIVSLTQAEYNAGTKVAGTVYIIIG